MNSKKDFKVRRISMNIGKKKVIIVGLVGIVTLTLLISTLPVEYLAQNNGVAPQPNGEGNIEDFCGSAFGCHDNPTALVPISMAFNPAPPFTTGQAGINLDVTINMDSASANSMAGVAVRVGPSGGGNARTAIENDGWVITNDPRPGATMSNYVEFEDFEVPAGDWILTWVVTAPSTPATYYVESTVWFDDPNPGDTSYGISSELTVDVTAPPDNTPPETSNVQINLAPSQTYPLSAIPTLTLTATIDDSSTGGSDIASANYTIGAQQWGTVQSMSLQSAPTSPTEVFEATLVKPTQAGTYTYYVYGTDNPGNGNTTNVLEFATLTITDDVPPEISTVLINGAPAQTYPISAIPALLLEATIDDSNTGNTNISAANYTIGAQQWGTVQSMTLQSSPTSPTEVFEATLATPTQVGIYTYYPYGSDDIPNDNTTNVLEFATLTITDDIPPEVSNVRVNNQPSVTVTAGTIVYLNATIDDTNTGGSNVSMANYTIDPQVWPGTDMNPKLAPYDNPFEEVNITVNTGGWVPGFYDLYVYARDEVPNLNLTSTEFATIVIATELEPPEISNVLINDAPSQTYPLSSIPTLTLNATIDDSATGDTVIGGANYTIGVQNWPSSQDMNPADSFDTSTEDVTLEIPAPTAAGTYYYYVYGWDANLNRNTTNVAEYATLTIIDDIAPDISNVLVDGLAMTTVTSGTIVSLTATIDDTNTGNSNISKANYTIGMAGWPSIPMDATIPPFDNPMEDVNISVNTTGWTDAAYDLYVYASDIASNDNLTSTSYATITILTDNTPPEITNVMIDGMTTA
jgi:hypothetical protein